MPKDTQSRKYLITINNFLECGYTRDTLRERVAALKSLVYFCAAEEKGLEKKVHHIHVYMLFSSPVRFSTMQKTFDLGGDIESCKGSSSQNRDYVGKTGKWENDEKADTKIPDTFEEWGEMPEEIEGRSTDSQIVSRILEGASNGEILREFPKCMRTMRDVEYVRQVLRAEEYREKWRDLSTTYIWGATGTGKTRGIMDKYGYSNVYHVNSYKHPFDGYAGEDVILFDEYDSNFQVQEMNNFLDGYPLMLPARYSNRQACYTKAYIVSNIDLMQQYKTIQNEHEEVWNAFLRRIHKVVRYFPNGKIKEYTREEYIKRSIKELARKHAKKIGGDGNAK